MTDSVIRTATVLQAIFTPLYIAMAMSECVRACVEFMRDEKGIKANIKLNGCFVSKVHNSFEHTKFIAIGMQTPLFDLSHFSLLLCSLFLRFFSFVPMR